MKPSPANRPPLGPARGRHRRVRRDHVTAARRTGRKAWSTTGSCGYEQTEIQRVTGTVGAPHTVCHARTRRDRRRDRGRARVGIAVQTPAQSSPGRTTTLTGAPLHLGTSAPPLKRVTPGQFGTTKPAATPEPFVPRQFTVLGAGDVLLHPGPVGAGARGREGARTARVRLRSDLHLGDPAHQGALTWRSATWRRRSGDEGAVHRLPGLRACRRRSRRRSTTSGTTPARPRRTTRSTAARRASTGRSTPWTRPASSTPVRPGRRQRPRRRTCSTSNGVTVAQLSYAYGFNGADPPGRQAVAGQPDQRAGHPRGGAPGEAGRRRRRHRQPALGHGVPARPERAAAAGREGAARLADVDLILGCHAHVVQPFQKINGKWVVYGMGNQIATQGFSKADEGRGDAGVHVHREDAGPLPS